jgi:hypothetical protein
MSMLAYAMTLLPTIAVLIVAAFFVADRRDGAALNELRDLSATMAEASSDDDALESAA